MAGLPGQDADAPTRTAAALRRLGDHVVVHALPYQAHPGTPLPGPSAAVPAETLRGLQMAPAARPVLWRRTWRWLRDTVLRRHRTGPRSTPQGGAGPCLPDRTKGGSGLPAVTSPEVPSARERDAAPESFRGARVFLTGGNGFVGGHVAAALVAAGAAVVALVRPGSGPGALAELPAGSVTVVWGDLAGEPDGWKAALAGCRYCFHLAALYAGPGQAEQMYAVNVRGTNRLLAACAEAGVARVVHTSTVGCVGRPDDPRALPDESIRFNLWHSASPYVRSKYLGELVARAWNSAGLPVVIVQPTAPVGPGDARPTATGARIRAALRGEAILYPPGGVNHVPVQDVAAGHLLAALRGVPGERYILGHCDGNLDHAAFLRMVARAAGRPSPAAARPRPQTGQMPQALTVNPSRAVHELGLPQSDLQQAFAAATAWFQAHP